MKERTERYRPVHGQQVYGPCRHGIPVPPWVLFTAVFFLLILLIAPVSGTSITMPGMNEIPGLFVSPGSSGDIADLTPVSVQGPGGSAGMSRYLFRYDVVSGTWQAGNSYQRIGILTTQDGRVILSAANGSAVMLLAGIGRGDTLTRSPVNTIHADGNRLEILHGTTKEWYVNGRSGIEQGMTIPTRPEGRGSLTISYALAGDLRPALLVGQALLLSDQYGPVIVYGGLKARDATGKVLPSGMLRDGNRLNWQIDDRDAVYPVTIDPVVVSASKATATFTGVAANDEFGYSTALSSDGSTALVGALQNGTAGTNAGAAYIFVKPAGGWSGTTSASAANATFTGGAANDNFGVFGALSSDGSTALVGAWQNGTAGTNAGAAYIFVKPAGGWSGTTSASAANATFTGGAANDNFGVFSALSSDGSTALVSSYVNGTAGTNAGAAYIFTKPGGGWSGRTSASAANATFIGGAANDLFGQFVALSPDGSTALVGANQNSTAGTKAGAAYIFTKPGGGWSGRTSASAATATFTGGAANDNFGWIAALSSNGSTALVGAYQNSTAGTKAGAAYIFQRPYVTLIAGGTTTGTAGTVVNGLTLNPSGTLSSVDLYLGTDAVTPTGTAVKTGIPSLPVSVATTVNGVDLTGKTAGTYYLIACDSGTTTVFAATTSAVYTVTAATPTPTPAPVGGGGGSDAADSGRASSYAATSPGVPAGQAMTFALNQPITANAPGAFISVAVVTSSALGSTEITMADANAIETTQLAGRQIAYIASIEPVGVNPSSIVQGTITFALSGNWLSQHGLTPQDIVLMRESGGQWSELTTTFDHQAGNTYYFTATTPGFSYFAITTRMNSTAANATVVATAPVTPDSAVNPAVPVLSEVSAAVTTRATEPATAQTTAVPASGMIPATALGIPVLTMVVVLAGIVLVAIGGFLVRGWWICRHNPALFRKYE